jgi:hypothetical protein
MAHGMMRGDEEPFIYEMGIPVALAEWTVLFHANILQRVPMYPNRDAMASGYTRRIHSASCRPCCRNSIRRPSRRIGWARPASTARPDRHPLCAAQLLPLPARLCEHRGDRTSCNDYRNRNIFNQNPRLKGLRAGNKLVAFYNFATTLPGYQRDCT